MIVFKGKCFTEVRIRKRVDNHRQGGLWRESICLERKQDGCCLTWCEALPSKERWNVIVEEYLKKFNYQLSGLDILLTFFQVQMMPCFFGSFYMIKRWRGLYCSVLSIPSSPCACLDFRVPLYWFSFLLSSMFSEWNITFPSLKEESKITETLQFHCELGNHHAVEGGRICILWGQHHLPGEGGRSCVEPTCSNTHRLIYTKSVWCCCSTDSDAADWSFHN